MIRYALILLAAMCQAAETGVAEITAPGESGSASGAIVRAAKERGVRELRFGPGVFPLQETIATGLTLRGAGSGKTILRLVDAPAKGGKPRRSDVAIALEGGTIEGMTIEVAKADCQGLELDGTCLLRDVSLRSALPVVGAQARGRVWCDGLRVEGCATGIAVLGGIFAGEGLEFSGQKLHGLHLVHGVVAMRGVAASAVPCLVEAEAGTLADLAEVHGQVPPCHGKGLSHIATPEQAGGLLPVKPMPAAAGADADDVALVEAQTPGEATVISWGKPIKIPDWTAAIQAAIDSGKPVVRLPAKKVFVQGRIILRGAVRRLEGPGFHEIYHGSGDLYRAELVIADGSAPQVELSGLSLYKANITIRHTAKRSLVLRDIRSGSYVAEEGAGDLFAGHCAMQSLSIASSQHAWLRGVALSTQDGPAITNRGGDLWGMAVVTDRWTSLLAASGGRSELGGCLVNAISLRPKEPLIVVSPGARVAVGFLERPYLSVPYERILADAAGKVLLGRADMVRAGPMEAKAGAEDQGAEPAEAEAGAVEAGAEPGSADPPDQAVLQPVPGSMAASLRWPQ